MFSGLAKCEKCGKGMHYKKDRGYYICGGFERNGKEFCWNHKIIHERLIEMVGNDLKSLTLSSVNVNTLVEMFKDTIKDDIPNLKKEIILIERKINERQKIKTEALKTLYNPEASEAERQECRELKKALEQEIEELGIKTKIIRKKLELESSVEEKRKMLERKINNFCNFKHLTYSMIKFLIDSVKVIDSENIEIKYKFRKVG